MYVQFPGHVLVVVDVVEVVVVVVVDVEVVVVVVVVDVEVVVDVVEVVVGTQSTLQSVQFGADGWSVSQSGVGDGGSLPASQMLSQSVQTPASFWNVAVSGPPTPGPEHGPQVVEVVEVELVLVDVVVVSQTAVPTILPPSHSHGWPSTAGGGQPFDAD